ncbi:MAG TPA: hypothetical protein DIS74_02375 [Bacteroidales bacterium]|nr:hypothetical protein [Bacteroidales bacterium]
MMERHNKPNMTCEQLFEYYRNQNSEYASLVKMLPGAAGSLERTCQILEQCQKENKRLFGYYPGIDQRSYDTVPELETMEPIGSIIDGYLYLQRS